MRQRDVKAIAKAFGYTASYNPHYSEWSLSRKSEMLSYYTNDADDLIYTMLFDYRHRRNAGYPFSVEQSALLRAQMC